MAADIVLHSPEEIRGIAAGLDGHLLIAFPDGLAEVDTAHQTSAWRLALRAIDRNPLVDPSGRTCVLRGAAVVRLDDTGPHVIAGGFGEASTLFAGPHGEPWVLDQWAADPAFSDQSAELVKVGARLGDERRIKLGRYPAAAARNAIALDERRIFVLGSPHSAVIDLDELSAERWVTTDITNPRGLVKTDDGKLLAICDKTGVSVVVLDPESGGMADLVSMNLSGSVSEATRDHDDLYVLSHAPVEGRPVAAVVKISPSSGVLTADIVNQQAVPVPARAVDEPADKARPRVYGQAPKRHTHRSTQPEPVDPRAPSTTESITEWWNDALDTARRVETDHKQRTVDHRFETRDEAATIREALTRALHSSSPGNPPVAPHVRPWVWTPSSTGRPLTCHGRETGIELRLSYYREAAVDPRGPVD